MKTLNKILLAAAATSALTVSGVALAEDVTLGFAGGFTGPIESLTPPIFAGANLVAAEVNANGGILGGGTLSFVSADTTCGDATASANAGDRLVNTDNVTAIVGALCSGATIAAANNAAIPGNVVMISPASTSPALTTLDDNGLVFRTAPSDAYQGEVLAGVVTGKGITEVAVTYVNNDYGKGFADAFVAAFEANGGTVTASVGHEDGKADYRSELGSLAGGAGNLVVLAYANGSGQTIMRQAIESGDFTTYIGGDGMVGDELFTGVDASMAEGMIATKPGTPELPGADRYSAIASHSGEDATAIFAPQAYDAAMILALAIEANGSADRDGLADAVRSVSSAPGEVILPGEWAKAAAILAEGGEINYEGAAGSHEFDDNGDVPGVIVEMTVTGGEFVQVDM